MGIFLDAISSLGSVAIVGTAKNAGKTECMNFVIRHLHAAGKNPVITSIGVDGETTDKVTFTAKPEITLYPGMTFVTSEKFYNSRKLVSMVTEVEPRHTALGKLVSAEVVAPGKVILAGPPDTASLKKLVKRFNQNGKAPVIIDGALSRLSLGAPTVTDAMVLATGASLSPSIGEITSRTAYICKMIDFPEVGKELSEILVGFRNGIFSVENGVPESLDITTGLEIRRHREKVALALSKQGGSLYIAGAITDGILEFLCSLPESKGMTLIIRDFTCMFSSAMKFNLFRARGAKVKVLEKPKLLGICINPLSPYGYKVDSDRLRESIEEKTGYPVIDVKKI